MPLAHFWHQFSCGDDAAVLADAWSAGRRQRCEVGLGALVLFRRWRVVAGWG
jgi:hypothetical protein